jgi:WD40 repeat protein
VLKVAFTPDGRRLASLSGASGFSWVGDQTIRIWEVDPRLTLPVLRGHTSYDYPVAFSPNGLWIASRAWDNMVRLWDAVTGEPVTPPLPHPGYVLVLAFSPDAQSLVTGSYGDVRLRIWDVATARVRKGIQGPGRGFLILAVSPDRRRLASWSHDFTVRLWEVESGACEVLRGHTDEVFAAAFHPDGTRLATAGRDRAILLWDLTRREEVARLQGHTSYFWSLAFTPTAPRWCRALATLRCDYGTRRRSRIVTRRGARPRPCSPRLSVWSSSCGGKRTTRTRS